MRTVPGRSCLFELPARQPFSARERFLGSILLRRSISICSKPKSGGEDWVAQNQDSLRAAPLAAGGIGIAGVVLNRTFSGAVGLDSSSAESRTDVIIIALSAVLLLTGLQWLALRPVEKEAVELDGNEVEYAHRSLSVDAHRELVWTFQSLVASTRCRALVVFFKDVCIFHYGKGGSDANPASSRPGPICQKAIHNQQGNYLANLALYPGRFEFLEYLPRNTQGVVVKPIGSDGVLVAAADTQRGFGNIDQAWLALITEKLDSTLEGYVPSGKGFKEPVAAELRK